MSVTHRDTEALRDDIVHTRAELGQTLEALAARADVRTRARASATRAADRMRGFWRSPTPWLMLTTAAAATAAVLLARGRRW
jgi:anti-sigma-K factor RskA